MVSGRVGQTSRFDTRTKDHLVRHILLPVVRTVNHRDATRLEVCT